MISQTAEYALRGIVYLAMHEGKSLKTHDIAVGTRVPAGYLAKVLQGLGRANVVRSHRGVHGGFSLVRSPEELTVLDVVNAVDPLRRIHRCPLDLETHGTTLCPLHRRLDDATAHVEEAFASCTIADLLATPTSSRPLCEAATVGGRGAGPLPVGRLKP